MKRHLVTGLALIALIFSGCGGGGNSKGTTGGGGTTKGVSFLADASYNGTATTLTGTTLSVGLNEKRIVDLTTGPRTIAVSFPRRSFATGDTFTPGADGTVVEYTEVVAKAGGTRKWTAIGGTVTVTSATSSKVNVKLNALAFQATSTEGDLQAAGSFTATGEILGFPNEAAASLSDIRFSSVTGTGLDTTPYPTDATVTVTTVDGEDYYSVARQVNAFPASQISFKIPKEAAVGQALPLGLSASGARAYLFQLSPSESLQATSGTVTIVSKSTTGVHLTFSGVQFRDVLNTSSADSVVVDGSITK